MHAKRRVHRQRAIQERIEERKRKDETAWYLVSPHEELFIRYPNGFVRKYMVTKQMLQYTKYPMFVGMDLSS